MSLDLESRLRTFFASAPQIIYPIQTLQISHSAMSKMYHLWQQPYAGQTWADGVMVDMESCNFDAKLAGSEGNLDQKYTINLDLTDVFDEFREQMRRIPIDTKEKARIVYREFLSDDLTSVQAQATLQVESVSYIKGSASLSAVAPRLNILSTGELYDMRSVPMLRGFL